MRFPTAFVSHGAPQVALEREEWGRALGAFAAGMSKPRAILVVSGHWEAPRPVRVSGSERPATIHDFSGFPEALYRIEYPAPGDPDLAARIAALLEDAGIPARVDPRRGLDHGAWVPLRFLYPAADIPVVAVSQPLPRTPADALRVGEALGSLREQEVLILGTGGVVHNLRRLDFGDTPGQVADWARAFDDWFAARLAEMDVAALSNYPAEAPFASLAVPTPEHFDPVFVTLGAARPGERAATIHEGFRYGTISMRSFSVGA